MEEEQDRWGVLTNASWIGGKTSKGSQWKLRIWIAWSRLKRRSRRWNTMTSLFTEPTKRDRSSANRFNRDWMQASCQAGSLMAFFCSTRAVLSCLTKLSAPNSQAWISMMSQRRTLNSSRTWLIWTYQITEWTCRNYSIWCPCKN